MKPVLPLEWEPSKVNYTSWQEIHSRVHAQENTNLIAGTIPSSRKINTTAPLAGGGNLSADLTLSINTNGITNALLAQMPANTLKGNNTAGLANAADLTVTQATAMLNLFTSLLQGLVPASGGGTTNFLRADGAFTAINLAAYAAFASPAGANNDVVPGAGWPTGIGRLDVTLAAGVANWTGMVAGTDGQMVLLANADAANTLTLNNQNVGSAAANRFRGPGDLALPPGDTVLAVYYAGSVNRWVLR